MSRVLPFLSMHSVIKFNINVSLYVPGEPREAAEDVNRTICCCYLVCVTVGPLALYFLKY
jgi:hypothetical protein